MNQSKIFQFALTLLTVCVTMTATFAVVHRITAVAYPTKGGAEHAHLRNINNKLINEHGGLLVNRQNSHAVQLNQSNYNYVFLANISVGTPAQSMIAGIDLFHSSDTTVISSTAAIYKARWVPEKHTFNSSQSSTFLSKGGNFSTYEGNGTFGNDNITLGSLSASLTFDLADRIKTGFAFYPYDALLGLNPQTSKTNFSSTISQIGGQLDKPIMTFLTNYTLNDRGQRSFQLTLGSEDTDNCRDDWVDAPLVKWENYNVHVASASAKVNGTTKELKLNVTLELDSKYSRLYTPKAVFQLFKNASGATYNDSLREYTLDCDKVGQAANVTLFIGNEGSAKPLVLTGYDYFRYTSYSKICYLAVNRYFYSWYDPNVIVLNAMFMNNHCVRYNSQDRRVGFANARRAPRKPQEYD